MICLKDRRPPADDATAAAATDDAADAPDDNDSVAAAGYLTKDKILILRDVKDELKNTMGKRSVGVKGGRNRAESYVITKKERDKKER